ncbi:hypothetical protein [Actinoplanes palleronii]|uniref:hypothetical protein n=1 Tax=Actinoplanes palleronii TaxID=113570 RepID=UPI001942045C|nr:hypothetical protein [Actinoplanes palleronii]
MRTTPVSAPAGLAAASEQARPARPFGSTVGGLIGRTTCPLIVVPAGADRPASRWPAALPGIAR